MARGFWSQGTHGPRPADDDEARLPSIADDLPKPPGIENLGPSPPFGVLANLFSSIEAGIRSGKRKPGAKREKLEKFFAHYRKSVGVDLYPVVRLMLPDRDNKRKTYHLKEQKLAKAYISALTLPPKSDAALKLEHWKVPTKKDPTGAGEFSTVAYEVIKSRSTVQGPGDWTITDVNLLLDRLSMAGANTGANGKPRSIGQEHARLLAQSLDHMNAEEQKFLVRIILKDLKLGLGERTVFEAMHQDAMELFNTCSDILRVCWKLYDVNYRLPREDQLVVPGRVFRPMLCQRNDRNLSDIVKKMKMKRSTDPVTSPEAYAPDEFIIEEKLDGERMQLHKVGNKWQYSSRKSTDYTHFYGATSKLGSGSLTPFIADLFHPEMEEVILDGEMLVWDPQIQKYLPFGNLKTYAMQKSFGADDPRPCFKVFDVLYTKSTTGFAETLLGKKLWQRKALLNRIFTERHGVLEYAEMVRGRTVNDISGRLKYIVDSRGEGIVIKNPDSRYVLGGRENSWIKVKPDYMDELGETVDACVIGAYWGEGNRGGRHASFLVGLRDDTVPEVDGQPVFKTFAKVGSGFTVEKFKILNDITKDKWFSFNKKKPPGWFITINEWPDQLIRPEDSFIVTIKAAEIVLGANYGCGETLRFPRALRVDEDKTCHTAMSLPDLVEMKGSGKKRQIGVDLRGKKKKVKTAADKSHAISGQLNNVEIQHDMFKGLTFYVHTLSPTPATKASGKPLPQKQAIEKLIVSHGGAVIQTAPKPDGGLVIATQLKGTLASKKGIAELDIVSPNWVEESVERGRRMPLYERFYIRALDRTKLSEQYLRDEIEEFYEPEKELVKDEDPKDEEMEDEEDFDEDEQADIDLDNDEKTPAQEHGLASGSRSQTYREPDSDSEEPGTDDEDDFVARTQSRFRSAYELSDVESEDNDDDDITLNDAHDDGVHSSQASGLAHLDISSSNPIPQDEDEDDTTALTDAAPGLGAGEEMGEYDPDVPFRHLVAYFDTSENAVLNRLAAASDPKKQVSADKILQATEAKFVAGGGESTTNLLERRLTHLVAHKTVQDRLTSLVSLTSQPRYRRLVSNAWVNDSLEAQELLDEREFVIV